eukprot:COSAG02_NODE_26790_length_624_cov_1.148571_1_plen_93_part_00
MAACWCGQPKPSVISAHFALHLDLVALFPRLGCLFILELCVCQDIKQRLSWLKRALDGLRPEPDLRLERGFCHFCSFQLFFQAEDGIRDNER